jgi:hypothetical protein
MARAGEIAELRALGLSLTEVVRVFEGDAQTLKRALAAHEVTLQDRVRQLSGTMSKVRRLRADLSPGETPAVRELMGVLKPAPEISVAARRSLPFAVRRSTLVRVDVHANRGDRHSLDSQCDSPAPMIPAAVQAWVTVDHARTRAQRFVVSATADELPSYESSHIR